MKTKSLILTTILSMLATLPAYAHTGIGAVHGLLDGVVHPLIGIDHLLVMLAVGLWAAMRGGKSLWLLPLAFVTAMGVGAGLSMLGITINAAETWVAASVIAAGVLVWRNTRMSSVLAVALVSVFALAHGYVHALELTDSADALAYSAGFLLTTAALHGLGLAVGLLAAARLRMLGDVLGLVCALVGVGLLAGG
ncbi:HupE/UreJ family protein [Methylovulum miyakonense]|uniref:HupE/UreJ family protein n=1 Tax=Methylovulum miyakonense TaxID=645578 RepID=UPI00036E9E20|nr:HupE/UreJ family protein [Methylovulum miyakonense]